MRRFFVLLRHEMKLSIRDMNMIIFAVLMPLVILVVLGIIYGGKPAYDGAPYTFMEQSFGAACAVSMCAGGLMGLPLVVSDYRERKILKRFRVTPAHPALLLAVELSVYVLYCAASLLTLALAAGVIASILYFPMLVFSGTTLPVEVMPRAMQRAVSFLPLTQGMTLMKNTFLGISGENAVLPVLVMLGVTALCAGLAVRFFRWE